MLQLVKRIGPFEIFERINRRPHARESRYVVKKDGAEVFQAGRYKPCVLWAKEQVRK